MVSEIKQLLYNAVQAPDGTIIESRTQHDYVEYTQEDGFNILVDGGLSYSRYGGTDLSKIKVLNLYYGDPHEKIREAFSWGSYGKNGDEKLHYIKLKDLTKEHLLNLISYTKTDYIKEINLLLKDELVYRRDNEIYN